MTGSELASTVVQRRGSTRFGVTGSWNGGNPTADWGQCTAVPHDIEIVLFGRVLTFGNGKDMFPNAPAAQYHKLAGNVEILPGDIVVQGGDPVLGTDYRYGHAFMATQRSVPGQAITGYSQNYPTGYPPHFRTFPRNGLIGALRAKVLQSEGGASVDPARIQQLLEMATFAGDQTYYALDMHVPEPGANSGRIGGTWGQLYAAIVNGGPEARQRVRDHIIDYYVYILGRDRNAKAGQPGYINIAAEIDPRVESIIRRESTWGMHRENIKASPEAIARAKTIAAALQGSDVVALQRLETAKQIARQLKLTNGAELDKIINA